MCNLDLNFFLNDHYTVIFIRLLDIYSDAFSPQRAIEASLQEKQKEERRQRQKMRESKAEEEEQLLLAQYQSMAATAAGGKEEGEEKWREGGDNGAGREGGEEVREANHNYGVEHRHYLV